jgi:hypothetical protein
VGSTQEDTVSKKQKGKVIKVGEICIDSGQVIICDPTYAVNHDGMIPGGLAAQLTSDRAKDTSWGKDAPIAVVSFTGLGDGVYPVYARVLDCKEWGKRVASLHVSFLLD